MVPVIQGGYDTGIVSADGGVRAMYRASTMDSNGYPGSSSACTHVPVCVLSFVRGLWLVWGCGIRFVSRGGWH